MTIQSRVLWLIMTKQLTEETRCLFSGSKLHALQVNVMKVLKVSPTFREKHVHSCTFSNSKTNTTNYT